MLPCTDTAAAGGAGRARSVPSAFRRQAWAATPSSREDSSAWTLTARAPSQSLAHAVSHPRSGPGTDPGTAPQNRARLSEEGRGRHGVRSRECPPRAAQPLSLGAVCFHCVCVPGTQLLSNWIKLSQNAGSALLTGAGARLCPWGSCLPGEVATWRS